MSSNAIKVIDDDEDRISKLPDEILVSIFSLLSVEESEKIRELSRGWKNLWEKTMIKVTPRLNFNGKVKLKSLLPSTDCEEDFYDRATTERARNAYVDWVDQILKLHESQTLDEFAIRFPLVSNHSLHINEWLEFASEKLVQKLKLDFEPFLTLQVGFLSNGHSNYNGVALATLKLHWLRDAYFSFVNLDENVINCLLSNSPLLERLSVTCSSKLRKFELVGTNKLEFLELKGCLGLRSIQISWAPNLRVLNLLTYTHTDDQRIDICAPNLRSFKYAGNFGLPIQFKDGVFLHNLSYVKLYFSSEIKFDYFQKLLGHFSTVKRLILVMSELQVGQTIDMWHQFPELSNVEYLEMSCRTNLDLEFTWSEGLLWPCALVKAAPFLHSLSLKLLLWVRNDHNPLKDFNYFKEIMEEVMAKKEKANITYSHQNLKVVKVDCFTGCRTQVEFVLHLVDIAVSLEKITLCVFKGTKKSYVKIYQKNASLLKTKIRPEINVVII